MSLTGPDTVNQKDHDLSSNSEIHVQGSSIPVTLFASLVMMLKLPNIFLLSPDIHR